jgi:hypothetical protein
MCFRVYFKISVAQILGVCKFFEFNFDYANAPQTGARRSIGAPARIAKYPYFYCTAHTPYKSFGAFIFDQY